VHVHGARVNRLVALGVIACVVGGCVGTSSADVAGAAARDGKCAPVGRVLARGSGVAVGEVKTGHRVVLYACVPARGVVHDVVHAGPTTAGVVAAGPYVGFDYDNASHEVFLDVFDAQTGHTELRHVIGNTCLTGGGGSNNVCGIDPWVLAPTGWVAVLDTQGGYSSNFPGILEPDLLASNGRYTVTNLDEDAAEDLRVSGSTLTWSITGGARFSAPLGPQLDALGAGTVPTPTPLPAPCSLITAADAEAVLGPVHPASSSTGGDCAYKSTGGPSSKLTIALQPSLTPAQVMAAKTAAYQSEAYYYTGPSRYSDYTWTASWQTSGGGVANADVVRFVGDVELTLDVTTLDPTNTLGGSVGLPVLNWNDGDAAVHFSDLAFDRLMGWPVLDVATG
jgi:hypothetical protein